MVSTEDFASTTVYRDHQRHNYARALVRCPPVHMHRDERGVDELFGEQVEVVVQLDDRPGLTKVVDADRDHPSAEHGSEPRERVAGGVVHGDDRARVARVAPTGPTRG